MFQNAYILILLQMILSFIGFLIKFKWSNEGSLLSLLLSWIFFLYMHFFGMQNLLYVKEVDTPNRFGGIEYIGFEKLTFVPIQVYKQCLGLIS